MTLTFSELLQDVYDGFGRQVTKGVIATGGSTSTIIDTTLGDDYADDDFINSTAFVRRDAGGAGAAPQNEIAKVTAYTASTQTFTFAASSFTAAIAAGDEIVFARPNPFPLADVKRLCNTALRELGGIRQYDTSLTTAAQQTEYTLPDAIRVKPYAVWIQGITNDSNDNRYFPVSNFRIEEGAEGADWTLIIPQFASGRSIKLEYRDVHRMLSVYNDPVSESIPSPLAVAVCAWYCATWVAMQDETWQGRALELKQRYEVERMRNPIGMKPGLAQGIPHWSRSTVDRVPSPITT